MATLDIELNKTNKALVEKKRKQVETLYDKFLKSGSKTDYAKYEKEESNLKKLAYSLGTKQLDDSYNKKISMKAKRWINFKLHIKKVDGESLLRGLTAWQQKDKKFRSGFSSAKETEKREFIDKSVSYLSKKIK